MGGFLKEIKDIGPKEEATNVCHRICQPGSWSGWLRDSPTLSWADPARPAPRTPNIRVYGHMVGRSGSSSCSCTPRRPCLRSSSTCRH